MRKIGERKNSHQGSRRVKIMPSAIAKAQNAVSPQFQALRWRLLGSYLMVMVAIRVISNGVVLLLARTDATTAAPTREWTVIPLDELLEDVEERLEPNAEAQDITLKCKLQSEVFVKGDASQLFRVFCNLLENALQYTPY